MFLRSLIFGLLCFASVTLVAGQQSTAHASSTLSFGSPDAQYRIEVFYDLQCGACSPFHKGLKKIVDGNPGKVFVTIRHYPLVVHDKAFMASTVVEAARRQAKGLEMLELLLNDQSRWSSSDKPFSVIFEYVDKLNLDEPRFKADVLSDEVIKSVLFDIDRARRLGIEATPTTFLNGKQLSFVEATELEKIISESK